MKTHKDLDCWKESMELAMALYKTTSAFPQSEMYGLAAQMRRAVVSIPSNIAEGAARQGNKEFIQFLFIALGSCAELETQVILSRRLNYIDNDSDILQTIDHIEKLIFGLIKYLKK
jgi:four helix bundle protein